MSDFRKKKKIQSITNAKPSTPVYCIYCVEGFQHKDIMLQGPVVSWGIQGTLMWRGLPIARIS